MDLNSQLQAAASYSMPVEPGTSSLQDDQSFDTGPPIKKTRTNTPWTAEEERRLKELRDIGTSWSEIGKVIAFVVSPPGKTNPLTEPIVLSKSHRGKR
ncbi:MAG: hypothetical protein GOMPHAMPRED_000359 [Gomphillus americanus]|uniref:Uncharacterized protein n=1 Tax=Gomphillus americanus TaxID=1940652 RepID=A0A8H3EGH8_9LECA|nr:MAG: hypothetical protein GOMPHAMPRED_000359 [Gomphillus americanus]